MLLIRGSIACAERVFVMQRGTRSWIRAGGGAGGGGREEGEGRGGGPISDGRGQHRSCGLGVTGFHFPRP